MDLWFADRRLATRCNRQAAMRTAWGEAWAGVAALVQILRALTTLEEVETLPLAAVRFDTNPNELHVQIDYRSTTLRAKPLDDRGGEMHVIDAANVHGLLITHISTGQGKR